MFKRKSQHAWPPCQNLQLSDPALGQDDYWEFSPSALLDARLGIRYFRHDWVLPLGLPEVQKILDTLPVYVHGGAGKDVCEKLNRVNDEIVDLNPDLRRVRRHRNDSNREGDFFKGVKFKFPDADIDFFINEYFPAMERMALMAYGIPTPLSYDLEVAKINRHYVHSSRTAAFAIMKHSDVRKWRALLAGLGWIMAPSSVQGITQLTRADWQALRCRQSKQCDVPF